MLFFTRLANIFDCFSTAKRQKRERGIFVFWDGRGERSADPMEVWRSLNEDPAFNIDSTPGLIDAGDTQAMGVGAAAVRSAFKINSLADGGLTEAECVDLLSDFFEFLHRLKKNIGRLQTSPSPTETEFSPQSPAL